MKRKVVLCCICCFPMLSALAAPRLAVPPEGVAFGEIAAGETASKSALSRIAADRRELAPLRLAAANSARLLAE